MIEVASTPRKHGDRARGGAAAPGFLQGRDHALEDPMLKYSHPTLALVLDYWPVTIFAPAILVLIATLALITRWWDRRDQEAREAMRPTAPAAEVVVTWESGRQRKVPTPGTPRPDRPLDVGHDTRAAS
jgi:hypothetical protein